MTNDVVEGSSNKSYARKNYLDQKEFIDQKSGSQCRLPTLLEVIAVIMMNKVRDGKYLFGGKPYTSTRCQELNGLPFPLSVMGGSASGDGIFVDSPFGYGVASAAVCREI